MAMMPKRVKHRKVQRGKVRGNAGRGNAVAFGEFGLQALEPAWVPARAIEAGRIACTRAVPGAKVYIRIFPDKPVTARPAETRMGTGKGEPAYWVAVVKPGTVMFELLGCTADEARMALNHVAHKMPVKTRMIRRRHV